MENVPTVAFDKRSSQEIASALGSLFLQKQGGVRENGVMNAAGGLLIITHLLLRP